MGAFFERDVVLPHALRFLVKVTKNDCILLFFLLHFRAGIKLLRNGPTP